MRNRLDLYSCTAVVQLSNGGLAKYNEFVSDYNVKFDPSKNKIHYLIK